MTVAASKQPAEAAEYDGLTRAYLAGRRCSAQWRGFLGAFCEEMFEHAGPEEAAAFLRVVGRRMAGDLPLPEADTLEGIEAAMNAVWQSLDWGWVRLTAGERVIRIVHGAFPTLGAADTAQWLLAMSALLEGIYGAWFRAQGAEEGLSARAVGPAPEGCLEFAYGR